MPAFTDENVHKGRVLYNNSNLPRYEIELKYDSSFVELSVEEL